MLWIQNDLFRIRLKLRLLKFRIPEKVSDKTPIILNILEKFQKMSYQEKELTKPTVLTFKLMEHFMYN